MGVGVKRPCFASRAVLLGFALLLALTASSARAETALRLTLNGKIEGPEAPFLVALERGYFQAEGLDVTIEPSSGGMEPIARVASGNFDIGFGDINTLIRYRDGPNAVPIKAVFMVYNRPTFAIVGRKSRGVSRPSDLAGKKIAAPPTDNASSLWPVFAKVNDIDLAKVTVINAGVPVREPMLAAGEVDAVVGRSYSTPITLREKGVPADDITVLPMGSYAVALYGSAIFVHPKLLSEKPEAVRGFLRAYLHGLQDVLADPRVGAAAVVKRDADVRAALALERLEIAIRLSILTPETHERGLGGIDPARFATALKQLGTVYAFKTPPKLEDVFDPSFMPSQDERELPPGANGVPAQRWQAGQ